MLLLIPVIVILIGCMGLLVCLPDSGDNTVYVEQIKTARALAENGDYQNAIVYYKNAISKDSTQEDPYLELAKIYFQLNMQKDLFSILREGYEKTHSEEIYNTLAHYEAIYNNGTADTEKTNKSGLVKFNSTYANDFATFNYEKYSTDCTVKNDQTSADKYTVIYEQYDAVFEYMNSSDNTVINPSTGKPYNYARPTSIKLNNLDQFIIGISDGVTSEEMKSCGASDLDILSYNKSLKTYLVTFEYNGLKVTLGCDENGTVKGEDAYNEIIPKPGQQINEKTNVSGKIISVTTGDNVSNVTVIFHAGKNNKNGSVVETVTSANGDYSVELESGDYTVEVTAEGYNSEFFDLYVSDSADAGEQNFSISPKLASNEIRFVLEWGEIPVDLDSHLDGVCKTERDRNVSINYRNKSAVFGDKKVAELDVDDVSSFGPETITLYNTNGTYEYKVHRFSNDGDLASSGATVKIYTSSSDNPIVVTVPNDVDSEWWTVCTVKDGEIKDINGKTN